MPKPFSLIQALLVLPNEEIAHEFLVDLLTQSEREELEQRFLIAQQLFTGVSYKEIEQKYWASSTTVARVAKFLQREMSGYSLLKNCCG
jgi:TrpR-related protein YerC/YecD